MPRLQAIIEGMVLAVHRTPLHQTFCVVGCSLLGAALVNAYRWSKLQRLAAFIDAQPVQMLSEAVRELRRRHGREGSECKIVGVYEGIVACNTTPPLFVHHGRPSVLHSLQIFKERIHLWGWGNVESVQLINYFSQVPFELIPAAPGHTQSSATPQIELHESCVHVLSTGLQFELSPSSSSNHEFTIMHPQHPVLRRFERALEVGSKVRIRFNDIHPHTRADSFFKILRTRMSKRINFIPLIALNV